MENPVFQFILGVVPFLIALFLFGLYLYIQSISRKTTSSLLEARTAIRKIQKENLNLVSLSKAYSPDDPEPIGELSKEFNAQLVALERAIAETYHNYGDLHQKSNELKLIPFWKFWALPFQWLELARGVELLWQDIENINTTFLKAIHASENIAKLGDDLSSQSRDVMGKIQESMHFYNELGSRLSGEKFLLCGRNLKEWETTLHTQLPMTFLTIGDKGFPDTSQKESITRVHRLLKSAQPEINGLYERLKNWKTDLAFISTSVEKLNSNQKDLENLLKSLRERTVSPLQWGESQAEFDSLGKQLEKLNIENGTLSVDELRKSTHQVKRLLLRQDELVIHCQGIHSEYMDMLQFWTSYEIQQGNEWIRNTRLVFEQVKTFDDLNWAPSEDLADFRTKFEELRRLQSIAAPRDPAKEIQEDTVSMLATESRNLYNLHVGLRPRLDKVSARLKELQRQQNDLSERVTIASSVLAKTIPVIESNPFLKKLCGNTPRKMQTRLEQLSSELKLTQNGLMEVKARKTGEWFDKAEMVFDKWSSALTEEIQSRNQELDERFQFLGNFNNLEDIVITGVRDILKKTEQGGSAPLSRPGDERLLVVGREIWTKNDLWQKIVSNGRALEDIAGPVLERYQKAEKNRQLALKWMERGNEVVPEVLGWPPTTQNLNSERKQAHDLENTWNSLKWEHIQAIQLVGRLSDISELYGGLATQVKQVVGKAEQEQEKILDYDRKLEESKKLWLGVVTKFPEYRNLQDDIEKLFSEVDRDYEALKKRCTLGGLPYQQVSQNLRAFIRKLNDAMMPAAGNQVIDINGELQKRIF
jgi:hypothetical protein